MKDIKCPTCNGTGKVNPMVTGLTYKIIGERIRVAREKLRMSQDDLAGNVGILRTSITNLEAGRQKMPLEALYKISDALHLDIKDLLP